MRMMNRRHHWTKLLLVIFVLFLIFFPLRYWLLSGQTWDQNLSRPDTSSLWAPYPADESWMPHEHWYHPGKTPLVVVEEHYEVLKYWYQAAELGLIEKTKNLLIHIDAHVDGAVPFDVNTFPWFDFPRKNQDIKNMMQRNDMFITAAALNGLIDHMIWVWPDWDVESHEDEKDHVIIDYKLGKKLGKTSSEDEVCVCWKVRDFVGRGGKQLNKWECKSLDSSVHSDDLMNATRITPDKCDIYTSGVFESVKESKAAELLKTLEFKHVPVILDIDEDYFGCWSDMFSFMDVGIQPEKVQILSTLVSDLFCATNPHEERYADHFYTALITLILDLKSRTCENDEAKQTTYKVHKIKCMKQAEVSDYLLEVLPKLLMFLQDHKKGNLLCGTDKNDRVNEMVLQTLLTLLKDYSDNQLNVLSQVGICFDVSPSSPYFPNDGMLHVCMGDNVPNKTVVSFSLPENKDIILQTKDLKNILSSFDHPPPLITVCRSVRDGYTPKDEFRMIESAVLTTVTDVFNSSVSLNSAHFDGNLLGGALGWPEREKIWDAELINFLRKARSV